MGLGGRSNLGGGRFGRARDLAATNGVRARASGLTANTWGRSATTPAIATQVATQAGSMVLDGCGSQHGMTSTASADACGMTPTSPPSDIWAQAPAAAAAFTGLRARARTAKSARRRAIIFAP